MAAPCRVCGVLRLGAQLGKFEKNARNVTPLLQQVRFKKGEGRRKMAGDGGTKEKTKKWMYQGKKTKDIVSEPVTRDLNTNPVDNVWMAKFYEPLQHNLKEAVQMHREFCQPAMLNNAAGILKLSMLLDLRTKKKTKFMNIIKKTIVPPNVLDESSRNSVMVFVKDEEQRAVAESLGATFVGGLDLVKMIEKGEVRHDDFDHVVCHVDMIQDLTTVRKFLRESFPSKKLGNLGGNVGEMVKFFQYGVTYESEKLEEAIGQLTVDIGRLDMSDDQIQENFDEYIEAICSHRASSLGPFITKGVLTCPPSPERFLIDNNLLRPVSQRATEVKTLQQDEEEPAPKEEEDSDDEEPQAIRKR